MFYFGLFLTIAMKHQLEGLEVQHKFISKVYLWAKLRMSILYSFSRSSIPKSFGLSAAGLKMSHFATKYLNRMYFLLTHFSLNETVKKLS